MIKIHAKIGTHSSNTLVLWGDWGNNTPEVGKFILAMEEALYNQLHSQYRRLKSCQYWQRYKVDDINNDGFVFLSK